VQQIVTSAQADLINLNADLASFESIRITSETSTADLQQRFPGLAREVEHELTNHEWIKV
jgi:hypothetical protein